MNRLGLLDGYILRSTLWPLAGALVITLVALLLERVLRLLDALSQSSDRFGFVLELTANLVPHYLGLTLPAAFFVALFIVVTRLSDGSEIDAMLAGGRPLSRITAPFVALGLALMIVSLVLFGFVQPYSRYAYRAVLHSAEAAGWSGSVAERTIISDDTGLMITADFADASGRSLRDVFIRKLASDGSELITTARSAEIRINSDGDAATLILNDGQQLRLSRAGTPRSLAFSGFFLDVPMTGASRLLRARGGDERELTLVELVTGTDQGIPLAARLAELYGRLARALALPLLPLLAVPLGLAAKRGGRAPGVILAGIILIAFQNLLQLGQGLAASGRADALVAVGLPFAVFAALCVWIFLGSRHRPGDTPIARLTQRLALAAGRLRTFAPARGKAGG
ncbi:MAG: LptF/LptG family permease [Alphaproteobacteria bacterium]|nr:LptF/LptG family permease [Alphaproteobacteria bacterium]MBU2380402.1 LptF/LptG family permease [Alphaproteobacteria bacterium]